MFMLSVKKLVYTEGGRPLLIMSLLEGACRMFMLSVKKLVYIKGAGLY